MRVFKKICSLSVILSALFCLSAHPVLREYSDFTLLGCYNLYSNPDKSEKNFCFRTLNHEGGLKVRLLETGAKEQDGQWLYVLLNNGQWDENEYWIKPNTRFWIFLADDESVYDYSESSYF